MLELSEELPKHPPVSWKMCSVCGEPFFTDEDTDKCPPCASK